MLKTMNAVKIVLFSYLVFSINLSYAADIMLSVNAYNTEITVKSWKELRDEHIIKQDLDYSCGAVL